MKKWPCSRSALIRASLDKIMNLFYNPFLRVNEHSITNLIDASKPFVVIQRFEWPGIPLQKGFLLSAYEHEYEADLHTQELAPKEGKQLNLLDDSQREKVIDVVKTGSGYMAFYNGTIDRRHEKKLQDAYKKNVYHYIKQIRLKKDDAYEVRIFVEYGRVKAQITSGENSHTALFCDMIK